MRGESGRVAVRVRSLLSEQGRPAGGSAPLAAAAGGGGAPSGDEVVRAARGDEALRHEMPFGGATGAVGWWHRFAARVAARVAVRVDPGRRAAFAVAGAVALAAVLTGAWLVAERPRALAVSSTPSPIAGASSPVGTGARSSAVPPATVPSATAPASSAVEVVVDVAGKVRHPGVYRLPPGSRVENALSAAGGPLAGVKLDSLNLAAKVVDGQQISVGVAPAVGGAAGGGGAAAGGGSADDAGGSGGGGAGGPAAPVDLNSATLQQLETLPGVGPVLGQHILDWRTAHGRFATVDQLNDVPGIGEVKFAGLRDLVAVG